MGHRRQPRRPGATKSLYQFYLTDGEHDEVARLASEAGITFSAFVASAVLREAQGRGAKFYGDVYGGTCERASPTRKLCSTGAPADWWNERAKAFVCEPCGRQINDAVGGSRPACTPAHPAGGKREATLLPPLSDPIDESLFRK